jgi:hypothetical protein
MALAEYTVFLPMSGKNHEGNKSPDIYDGNEQRRILCSQAEREGHRNVQGQLRLLLGATCERGEDTKMSIGRKGCMETQLTLEASTWLFFFSSSKMTDSSSFFLPAHPAG